MAFELIRAAHKHHNISSVIIGSPRSFLLKRLSENLVPFKFLRQDDESQLVASSDADDLMINFNNFDGLDKLKNFRGRNLIWGILAPTIVNWNRFGFEAKITGKKIIGDYFSKRLIYSMSKKNSIVSMDGDTSDVITAFVRRDLNLPIIPVPVDVGDLHCINKKSTRSRKKLQISYIGRSDELWKIKPVKKIVRDLAKLLHRKFVINIYTDQAEPYIAELNNEYATNVHCVYHTGFYGTRLRSHINDISNLHFSMGTSALEGALAGVPTILIDPCNYEFPENYRYQWLFQVERNSLGRFIAADETYFSGMTMSEIIETCHDERSWAEVAEQCVQYVIANHSVLVIIERLLSHPAQATMKDICRFTPATWRSVSAVKASFFGA